jgi:hypothetical protein
MGSNIKLNDTLRINKQQGFPAELDLLRHLDNPYTIEDVKDKIFRFSSKPMIRVYQQPPVRNFLVEDVNGKWVYWGKCYILEIVHDYEKLETSGTYRVISINSPEDMQKAFEIVDLVPENNYFS